MKNHKIFSLFLILVMVLGFIPSSVVFAQADKTCWPDNTASGVEYCYPTSGFFNAPIKVEYFQEDQNAVVPLSNVTVEFLALHVPREMGATGTVIGSCVTDGAGMCNMYIPYEAAGSFLIKSAVVPNGGLKMVDPAGDTNFKNNITAGTNIELQDLDYPYLVFTQMTTSYYFVVYEVENMSSLGWMMYYSTNSSDVVRESMLAYFTHKPTEMPSQLQEGVFDNNQEIEPYYPTATPRPTLVGEILETPEPEGEQSEGINVVAIILIVMSLMLLALLVYMYFKDEIDKKLGTTRRK